MTAAVLFLFAASPWFGRWDLAVGENGGWMEVATTGVRIVPRVGGVKAIDAYSLNRDHLSFSNTEWVGKWEQVKYDLFLRDGRVEGTATRESGTAVPVAGIPAPPLRREIRKWGAPIDLTTDLATWKVMSPTKPGNWTLDGGVLANAKSGPNLRTVADFQDFRLDLEFNCPAGSNSGIFLRGRYELQIEEEADNHDPLGKTGSIYQFLAAASPLPSRPGQWRKLSVTLAGRSVTVTLDGVRIIDGLEIPGPTSGGFNSREEQPGPIILQGDHGPVLFRKIILTPGLP